MKKKTKYKYKTASTGRRYPVQSESPELVKKATARKQAWRMMKKKYGDLKGKDVDHIKKLKDGGTNKPSNLRLLPRSKNRSRNQ